MNETNCFYNNYFTNNSIDFVWYFTGPRYGLRLTLNVQKYENIPYLDLGSGVKARWQFNVMSCHTLTFSTVTIMFVL